MIGALLSSIPGAEGRSEILPRRLDGRGGASVVRRDAVVNRMEDLDVKIREEAISCIIHCDCCGSKALATTLCRPQE